MSRKPPSHKYQRGMLNQQYGASFGLYGRPAFYQRVPVALSVRRYTRQQRHPPGDHEQPCHPSRVQDFGQHDRACVCGRKSLYARQPALHQIGEARERHQVRDRSRDGRRPDDCCRQQHSETEREVLVERQSRRRRGDTRVDSSGSPFLLNVEGREQSEQPRKKDRDTRELGDVHGRPDPAARVRDENGGMVGDLPDTLPLTPVASLEPPAPSLTTEEAAARPVEPSGMAVPQPAPNTTSADDWAEAVQQNATVVLGRLRMREDSTGWAFENVFDPRFLEGAVRVRLVDPHLDRPHQFRNLKEFLFHLAKAAQPGGSRTFGLREEEVARRDLMGNAADAAARRHR